MKIAEFSVKRRITVMMMTMLIIILGGLSFTRLGLEMLPDMDFPVITVITSYHGASPEDIEEMITKPLEQSIATVPNLTSVKSRSMEGISMIMVEFTWGTNLDFAAQDLRDVIDQIAARLPRDVSRPQVMKFNLAQMPVLSYGITGNTGAYELKRILDDEVVTRLTQLPGVASVMAMSDEELEKQIIVDRKKMEYYEISLDEVVSLVQAGNITLGAGHIEYRKGEYRLRTVAEYQSMEEIAGLPVKMSPYGGMVYLEDIASVEDGFKERRSFIRTNLQPTAYVMISKESGANTLTVSNIVKEEIEKIEAEMGERLVFHEIMDMGLPIENVTSGVMANLLVGGLLAILIMYLFLSNWRPTLAITIAIPISVIATFVAIYLARFSLNLMTLGGLALGVGMLVDNSIVVIENIYRHIEMGKDRIKAAKIGATEVAMAITASTLTTIAVFFPMILSEGMTGILVRGLALTVAFSLFASLFIALTVVPAIAASIFKRNNENAKLSLSLKLFISLRDRYLHTLGFVLKNRGKTVLLVFILFAVSIGLIPVLGTEFMPDQDIPFLVMNMKMPIGTTISETDEVARQVEQIFMNTAGVSNTMAIIGPLEEAMADPTNPQHVSEAQIIGRLLRIRDREMNYEEIVAEIRSQLPKVEGGEFNFLTRAEMMGGGASTPIEINIFGTDLEELSVVSNAIVQRISGLDTITDVISEMDEAQPEQQIIIDKEKAFQYGLTSAQIASALNTATVGTVTGVFRERGEEYDIRVKLAKEDRNHLDDIMNISISSPMGFKIPLSQIAKIEIADGPVKIMRENQTRMTTITADIVGTRDVGGSVQLVRDEISDIMQDMPPGYYLEFGGAYQDMMEAFQTLGLALLLAVILVYAVMASQFESLKQPLIIMFTMPLAFIGVMAMLLITGITLSVASFVGIIILSGIVVNNGIVLVDHINQLRNGGMEKHKAIVQAGSDRVRPVLITAITTMMGMLPMALSTGEGAELKVPMAATVIGGLISATFFTLFIIPTLYSLFDKISFKSWGKRRIKEVTE